MKNISAVSLHPGVIATEIWRAMPRPVAWMLGKALPAPQQRAKTSAFCATDADLSSHNGAYFDTQAPRHPSRWAQNEDLALQLWDQSMAMVESVLGYAPPDPTASIASEASHPAHE